MSIACLRYRSQNMLRHPLRRSPKTGQTHVEFALVIPVLLLILFGIIEFGIIFSVYVGLTNAAREGARAGSLFQYQCPPPTPPAPPVNCRRNASVSALQGTIDTERREHINDVIDETLNPLINRTSLDREITYTPVNGTSSDRFGERVTVTLTFRHTLFFNLLGIPTLNLQARSTMRIEPGVQ